MLISLYCVLLFFGGIWGSRRGYGGRRMDGFSSFFRIRLLLVFFDSRFVELAFFDGVKSFTWVGWGVFGC